MHSLAWPGVKQVSHAALSVFLCSKACYRKSAGRWALACHVLLLHYRKNQLPTACHHHAHGRAPAIPHAMLQPAPAVLQLAPAMLLPVPAMLQLAPAVLQPAPAELQLVHAAQSLLVLYECSMEG